MRRLQLLTALNSTAVKPQCIELHGLTLHWNIRSQVIRVIREYAAMSSDRRESCAYDEYIRVRRPVLIMCDALLGNQRGGPTQIRKLPIYELEWLARVSYKGISCIRMLCSRVL